MKIIQIGAEAILKKEKNILIKNRIKKNYRIKEIDNKIRKFRTKREVKILSKLDFVPKVININGKNTTIQMEYIDGDLIRDILDKLNSNQRKNVCKQIGKQIHEMHQKEIIHGDLTTSNLILKDKKIFFIDFGLGFFSKRIEDKATDLRLLRQALESKHYKCFKEAYNSILEGYQDKEVLEWLKNKVEKRGRYKRKKNEI